MNPAWLIAGIHIGDRIAPLVRPVVRRAGLRTTILGCRAVIGAINHIEGWRGHNEYRAWLDSLPETSERGGE